MVVRERQVDYIRFIMEMFSLPMGYISISDVQLALLG